MSTQKNTAITLIELLVVIIIIGIIIAFGIPQYENVIRSARQKTARSCLTLIKEAQEIYRNDTGLYFPDPSWPAGQGYLANINSHLHLAILGDFLLYNCDPSGSNNYNCTATYPASGPAQWCCAVTANTNSACYAGACP